PRPAAALRRDARAGRFSAVRRAWAIRVADRVHRRTGMAERGSADGNAYSISYVIAIREARSTRWWPTVRPLPRLSVTNTYCPMGCLFSTEAAGDPKSVAPPSPQCGNLRVGPQLTLDIVTAGPEDDASGAARLELDETFPQLLACACDGHLFGGGYVDERVMAVRNVEVMTAVNGEVTDIFVCTF